MLDEDEKWFRVSLRLFGDALDPEQASELLQINADTIGIKGVARTGKNNRTYAPWETNYWNYQSRLGSEIGFDEQIRSLFTVLGSRIEQLKTLLHHPEIEGELFCGFSSVSGQGGDTIAPTTLKLVADTGLALSLDLYPPGITDEEESNQTEHVVGGNGG
jgi:hypothetical protein